MKPVKKMGSANFGASEWLTAHYGEAEQYEGQWVAVTENGILAAARTLKALMDKKEVRRASDPLFTKIPREDESVAIL